MRYRNQLTIFLFAIIVFVSCTKDKVETSALASLNVINAVISGSNTKLNTNVQDSVKVYNAKSLGLQAGSSKILLYPTSSPSTPYFNGTQQTDDGDIYSIFLCGQAPTFESFLAKDNSPAFYTDSSVGVRIINLSPNSTPLNITLASATTTNVFANVAYKQLTGFVKFPLSFVVPAGTVSFQVRNAGGTLLTTYTLPVTVNSTYPGISIPLSRFKNITLVIRGLMGATGSDGFGIFPVANY